MKWAHIALIAALLLMLHLLMRMTNQNPMPEFSKGLPGPRGMLLGLILYTE